MNLLIIGDYPVATQARMRVVFPAEWQLTIAARRISPTQKR